MTTPAEQEAERRYPEVPKYGITLVRQMVSLRYGFVQGAEWSESRYRELLEAAREYREASVDFHSAADGNGGMVEVGGPEWSRRMEAMNRLLAAAAALEEA